MNTRLAGHVITQIRFDYAFTLCTDKGSMLRISTQFQLTDSIGTVLLDPEELPLNEAGRLVRLFNQGVSYGDYEESGTFRLVTEAGSILDISPDERYEAWNLSEADNALAVCMVGGGVAEWPASK